MIKAFSLRVALGHSDVSLPRLSLAGIDLDDVSRVLEEEGVGAFVKSFDELLDTLGQKSETLT